MTASGLPATSVRASSGICAAVPTRASKKRFCPSMNPALASSASVTLRMLSTSPRRRQDAKTVYLAGLLRARLERPRRRRGAAEQRDEVAAVTVGTPVTAPPAQIRTCSFPAYGSHLGYPRRFRAVCKPAPVPRVPGTAPGACFADPHSPRSPPFAPPAPQRIAPPPPLVRRLHSYYGGARLLVPVHHRLRLLAFPMRTALSRDD